MGNLHFGEKCGILSAKELSLCFMLDVISLQAEGI